MDAMPSFLHIQTAAGADSFRSGLRGWSSAPATLQKRTALVAGLRAALNSSDAGPAAAAIQSAFATIAAHESVLRSFWLPPSEMENEGYSQLLFRGEHTIPLNHIPRLLSVWATLKIFILPAMQVSTPLLTFIAPFLIVKYVMKMPLGAKQYFKIAQGMFLGGGMSKLFGSVVPEMPALPIQVSDQARTWLQTGWVIISAIQSIMQPIQSAKHTHKLQKLIMEKAAALKAYIGAAEELRVAFGQLGIRCGRIPVPADVLADDRRLVAFALENPAALQMLDRAIGRYELWYCLAAHEHIVPVRWSGAEKPFFTFKNICDIGIAAVKQRPFSVGCGSGGSSSSSSSSSSSGSGKASSSSSGSGKASSGSGSSSANALLTGPNRGGKSTVLRATLRNFLIAHCFGAALGTGAHMTPFDWVQSCLRLEDLPGQASLFEREVAFASASLGREGRGAVFVDELFHSTNPPDAAAASSHYLQQLWARPSIVSIISTHVFELVEQAPPTIQRLCCPAELRPDGSVSYKYGLARGICRVSSVGEILHEQGLGRLRPSD
jgi:uncharacterized membrane protein YgcG